ncbi:ABC transporter substrate-binding protein [Paenibacillus lignilyticus]|uniref:ABC transporter substrate-binding protein n=1 Tax=Paenibacillus lignilyticus TaxID=1172615 RepID=A0ABS5CFI0_9BACL|nr:ABC transporter substrate-binding protein [Paenibacillus lignilyticus]MBP3964611.1 ABC transporter substrate-binding protein [Paenibacillus lignilyticus]
MSLTLMMSIVGCSSGNNNANENAPKETGNTATTNTDTTTNTTEAAEPAKEEPVTFTFFNATANKDTDTNKTEIGKILEDQTGVNFKMEHLVGDLNTKIGTMIASNEYPDILAPDSGIDKVLEAGAFIPLNDLIDQYGPNIKRVYGPYMNLMKSDDGNIYFLPFSATVGEYKPNPTIDQGAFWVQNRVLKDAGYPKIKTFDEYFNLIKDYAGKHKDDKLTGFMSLTHDWRFFATTNPPNHLAGYPNDGEVQVDMTSMDSKIYAANDDTKRWLKKLNEFNAEGLFDKSSFVDNYDQYLAKLTSGKVLGFFDYGWQVNQALQTLKTETVKNGGNDDLEYFPLPIVFDAGVKDQYIDPASFVNNRGVGITTSAKDPVRIIKFFNNLLTDENQKLVQWGIQGKNYEVDDKGRLYRTQEEIDKLKDNDYKRQVGIGYFEYYWPMYGQGSTFPDGNAVNPGRQPEVAQASFTAAEKDRLAKYGVQTYAEMFSAPDDRPWYPAWSIALEQGTDAQIYTAKKPDVQRKYFAKIVLASPDKFDALWNEYVGEIEKLPVAEYEKTMTEEVKEKTAKIKG